MSIQPKALRCWLAVVAACGLCAAGCQTAKGPGSDSLASITIRGHSAFEVARGISTVFEGEDFTPVPLAKNDEMRLVFEKKAGKGANFVYGDWGPGTVWWRVKIRISSLETDVQLVTCDLYRVLDHGDSHYEEEHRILRAKKGYYKDLLKKVPSKIPLSP